ncbi:hypothetical protein KC332_g5490 [Hortaea werneckii]|uniref:Stress response RCI peptide n=2 Tax=Hortaea werneckii TaxID=91943 RepID=A0A3M7HCR0_HORWE|nr:hypothetical protein KC358_g5409 [Hortaea werneckii]OTA31056.1 hypothetical protein BTJ68_09051 [Hortaea werneckii EXF-2000]KAI6845244.1 hypothetical protein KC350_g4533 [Hortaea werneckii]KAI6937788.1 hypothetical protein KC348_g5645 [Hortaea werneckii]KAI6938029.1 hypothetical protein KC341_g5178 [Hortaea werneckii]
MVLGGLALGIIAIFIPPLVVLLRAGCGANLLINIVLLFLGWIPAVLHAWFIIIDRPSARDRHRERKSDRAEHVRPSAGGGGRGRSRSRSRSVDTRKSGHHRRSYDHYPPPPHHAQPHYGYHHPSYSHPPPYPSEPYYGQQTGYAPAPRGSY